MADCQIIFERLLTLPGAYQSYPYQRTNTLYFHLTTTLAVIATAQVNCVNRACLNEPIARWESHG
jgi:hypothetical protein